MRASPERGKRRWAGVLLLFLILLLGGLLLPMGVIKAASEQKNLINNKQINEKTFNNNIEIINVSQTNTGTIFAPSATSPDIDLSISKSSNNLFTIGDLEVFEFQISNNSVTNTSGTIFFIDNFPVGLVPQSWTMSDPGFCEIIGQAVTCEYTPTVVLTASTTMAPIFVFANVNSAAAPTSTNKVSLYPTDNWPTNNVATKVITVTSADLEIEKTVDNEIKEVGDTVIYTLKITNNGPSTTAGVVVSDTLPDGIDFVSSGAGYDDETGEWDVGTVLIDTPVSLSITGLVLTETAGLTITNYAEILEADEFDWEEDNDRDDAEIFVQGVDLEVEKTDNFVYVYPDFNFVYTITVYNDSNITARNVVLTDTLGEDYDLDDFTFTYTEKTDNLYVFDLGDIGAGMTEVLTLAVTTDDNIAFPTDLLNTVTVTNDLPEEDTDDNTDFDENTLSDFDVDKSVSPTSRRTGETFNFQIKVVNQGESALENIRITDTYPAELDILRTNPDKAKINNNNHTISYTLDTLAAAGTFNLSVDAIVRSSRIGEVDRSNRVEVSAETPDGKPVLPVQKDSTSFEIIGEALPPTGFTRPASGGVPQGAGDNPAGVYTFLGGSGLLLVGLALHSHKPRRAVWLLIPGVLLVGVACSLLFPSPQTPETQEATGEIEAINRATSTAIEVPVQPTEPVVQFEQPYLADPNEPVPETLPDFPVPAPANLPESVPGGHTPDPSPANRLVIPKIGLDTVIKYVPFSDYTWLIAGLRQEIAWMGETSYPGLGGNTGLAGHLNLPDGTAGPFFNLWKLKAGDQVIVYTDESKLTYRVRGSQQVAAADTSIIRQGDDPQLTLITCAGWSDRLRIFTQRLAVYADLIQSEPRVGAGNPGSY